MSYRFILLSALADIAGLANCGLISTRATALSGFVRIGLRGILPGAAAIQGLPAHCDVLSKCLRSPA